jgi:hypothetical protein
MRGKRRVGHVEDAAPGLPLDSARESELDLGSATRPFLE